MKNFCIPLSITLMLCNGLRADNQILLKATDEVSIKAPLALGEFFDKLTILMIKREKIQDPQKRINIDKEYKMLAKIYANEIITSLELQNLIENLSEVNRKLWELEDLTREKEHKKEFDTEFKQWVKEILQNNDTRFKIKRAINLTLGSSLVEEKSYRETLAQEIKMDTMPEKNSSHSRKIPLINIPISLADLLDRISILHIKLEKIKDSEKLTNIHHEYDTLMAIYKKAIEPSIELDLLYNQLIDSNKRMWDIQDEIRNKALANELDDKFTELGRSVYYANDARIRVKQSINRLFNSALIDEKMYTKYN